MLRGLSAWLRDPASIRLCHWGHRLQLTLRTDQWRYQSHQSSHTRVPHAEGRVARTIEQQAAKLPSDAFLWMAVGSTAVSATLQMMGDKPVSLFVGQ